MTYQQTRMAPTGAVVDHTKKVLSRRSHLEIRMDVLGAVMEGAEGPTQVMYRANLSWVLLCDHLKALVALGFVEETTNGNRKKYALTDKGLTIVKLYHNVVRELEVATASPTPTAPGF